MSNYSEKLRDPRWQKKRLKILERDFFKCTVCGDEKTELQVHHLKYSGQPWEVDESQLTTLCKHCHYIESFHHGTKLIKVLKHFVGDTGTLISKEIQGDKTLICFYSFNSETIEYVYGLFTDSEVFKTVDYLRSHG